MVQRTMTVLDRHRHFSNASFVYVVEIDGAIVVVVGCRSHRLRSHSRVVVVLPFSIASVYRRVAGDY